MLYDFFWVIHWHLKFICQVSEHLKYNSLAIKTLYYPTDAQISR